MIFLNTTIGLIATIAAAANALGLALMWVMYADITSLRRDIKQLREEADEYREMIDGHNNVMSDWCLASSRLMNNTADAVEKLRKELRGSIIVKKH